MIKRKMEKLASPPLVRLGLTKKTLKIANYQQDTSHFIYFCPLKVPIIEITFHSIHGNYIRW